MTLRDYLPSVRLTLSIGIGVIDFIQGTLMRTLCPLKMAQQNGMEITPEVIDYYLQHQLPQNLSAIVKITAIQATLMGLCCFLVYPKVKNALQDTAKDCITFIKKHGFIGSAKDALADIPAKNILEKMELNDKTVEILTKAANFYYKSYSS